MPCTSLSRGAWRAIKRPRAGMVARSGASVRALFSDARTPPGRRGHGSRDIRRVLRSLRQWDRKRPFEPWLLAIAGNRCRTLLARRGRQPKSHGEVADLPDPRPDMAAAKNLAEEVELSLDTLRDEYRQAFLLFHERHLSYDQISEILDCPLGTVKTWVHRARKGIVSQLLARGVVIERQHAVRRA